MKSGTFFRKSDSKPQQRYKCKSCGNNFSSATGSTNYGQNKRRLNYKILWDFCTGVSQRNIALKHNTTRKTVARKLKLLSAQAKRFHEKWLEDQCFHIIQFDDLETIEHTKLKPVTVPMVVSKQRQILGFEVARIPAKGHLSKRSRKKYGFRKNEAAEARDRLLTSLSRVIHPYATFECDEHPAYPELIARNFPMSSCERYRSKRSANTGQGELKKTKYDPLFKVNHTFAMLRYSMSRLIRKTWNTTKSIDSLRDHLNLYVVFHNLVVTHPTLSKKQAARKLYTAFAS